MEEIVSRTIKQEDISPKDDFKQPKPFLRLSAALLDFVIFLIGAIVLLVTGSFIVTRDGGVIGKENTLQINHIVSSKLAKFDSDRGYLKYEADDYYQTDNGEDFLMIKSLEYFYLSYMTNTNIEDDMTYSLDVDNEKYWPKENGVAVNPKEYYTVNYFNEHILQISLDSGTSSNGYFTLKKDSEGHFIKDKVGTISPEMYDIKEEAGAYQVTIKNGGVTDYLKTIYESATKVFFNQSFIKESTRRITMINSIVMLVATIPSMIVFYIVVPMCSKLGKTLGKRFLGISLINDRGYAIKKWQLLLRVIPLFATLVFISLVNNLFLQIILSLIILLVSVTLLFFTYYKQSLHDFIARTITIKDDGKIVFENQDDYLLYKKEHPND